MREPSTPCRSDVLRGGRDGKNIWWEMSYDYSAVLRKFKQGQQVVLQPKLSQRHPFSGRSGPTLSFCLLETICVWKHGACGEGSDGFSGAAESLI